jgi:hypothetical protein
MIAAAAAAIAVCSRRSATSPKRKKTTFNIAALAPATPSTPTDAPPFKSLSRTFSLPSHSKHEEPLQSTSHGPVTSSPTLTRQSPRPLLMTGHTEIHSIPRDPFASIAAAIAQCDYNRQKARERGFEAHAMVWSLLRGSLEGLRCTTVRGFGDTLAPWSESSIGGKLSAKIFQNLIRAGQAFLVVCLSLARASRGW